MAAIGEMDTESFVSLLRKIIGESKYVQNNPPDLVPEEDRVGRHVLEALQPYGTENGGPLIIQHVSYLKGRGNIIVEYPGTVDGKIVSFVGCHMDVVTANPEEWDFDPFSLSIEGDKLCGRGTTDCLGHVALITELMQRLGEVKPKLKSSVVAVFIANEENSSVLDVGVDGLVKQGLLNKLRDGPLYWIDTADKQPCIGTGGVITWKLHATGKLFHSGLPHKAINALELRRRRCQDFNSHRQMVHSWDPITLRVGAPPGPNYKVRSESFLKKERDRKNYNIEYQFKKRRNRIENVAIRVEIRKAGVKSAKELSIQALDRIKECVSAFDAQSAELREKIKNDIHKKIIRDKNWNVLRVMFDESPPMIEDEFSQPRIEAKSSQQRIGRQRNLAKMGQQNNHGGKQMRSLEPSIDEVRDPLGESIHDVDQDALCHGECSMPFPLSFVRSSRLVFDMKPHDVLPSVMGHHKYLDVKEEISKENATLLFNFKPGSNKLKVQLFKDVEIAPFLYDRLLAAYEKFPNNEEVFQYFAKMIYAELKEHMDLEHTNVQSKFFGVSKGCTYEQTEGHQTLGFKAPPPIVVPRPPRLDALPTDVESASPSALATGDVITKSVQATLSRVEVPSRERSQSPCRQFPNFVDIPDEDLRQMDRLELEKYASKCRDICRDLLKIQCRGMGVSIERGFSVGTERGFNGGADDMNLEGCLDMDMTTSSHAHEIATDVVSGQSREAPCVDGLTLNLLDPQGTKEDSIDNVAHGI